MVTGRDRKHSGYVTPRATMYKKDLIENGLFLNPQYDDWLDYRDGFRDWFRDFKKIKNVKNRQWSSLLEKRVRMNQKQKRLLRRRLIRKHSTLKKGEK